MYCGQQFVSQPSGSNCMFSSIKDNRGLCTCISSYSDHPVFIRHSETSWDEQISFAFSVLLFTKNPTLLNHNMLIIALGTQSEKRKELHIHKDMLSETTVSAE